MTMFILLVHIFNRWNINKSQFFFTLKGSNVFAALRIKKK